MDRKTVKPKCKKICGKIEKELIVLRWAKPLMLLDFIQIKREQKQKNKAEPNDMHHRSY